jgi:hypothetical protein
MVCGFVWVTRGLLDGHALSGPSVVWAAGEELPKDRFLLGRKSDEILFCEHDPKRSFRCLACGIIVATGIEDYSNDVLHGEKKAREEMFHQALKLDQRGDWSEAVALYEKLAEEAQDRQDAEYAQNCAQQIREKMKMAGDA